MIQQLAYQLVFRPVPQIYPGPDGHEVVHGQMYSTWVVNDHCHIQDENGLWHLFGITHPLTTIRNGHEGELQLFHAVGKSPLEMYRDRGTLLPPSERPGERPEIHSPSIIRKDGAYFMIYGPHQMRLARSADLEHWDLLGTVFECSDQSGRDPHLIAYNGGYLVSYCMNKEVYYRTSADLFHWSEPQILLCFPHWLSPESPFLFHKNGLWHLFVCLWDGANDLHSVPGAYQSVTHVYAAPELKLFTERDFCGTVRAHAPEIIEYDGRTWMTSAFYPENGIQIAEIIF